MSIRLVFLSILALGIAVAGDAGQAADTVPDGSVTSYELSVYPPGQDPSIGPSTSRLTFPASIAQCNQNQPPVSPPVVINPTRVQWQDSANPAKVCVADVSAFLRALPVSAGAYIATLTAIGPSGASSPSAPSNIFFRPN